MEEELFGPAEGLHSTFRIMRDELLDTVAQVGGQLGEMRLDAGGRRGPRRGPLPRAGEGGRADRPLGRRPGGGAGAVGGERAARPGRHRRPARGLGRPARWTIGCATRAATRPRCRPRRPRTEPSLDPFIPRRGDGVMLSASDIETYRLCPLKYKFARVFRIPQESTIHQRFGIVLHQVLERFHQYAGAARATSCSSCSRPPGGAAASATPTTSCSSASGRCRRWTSTGSACRDQEGEPEWFERSFSFQLGAHLLRGRVDRVDRLPGRQLRADRLQDRQGQDRGGPAPGHPAVRLPDGRARVVGRRTSAQSYMYVMTGEKVPVAALRGGAGSRAGHGRARSARASCARSSSPRPSQEICSFCDYRIICPAAER